MRLSAMQKGLLMFKRQIICGHVTLGPPWPAVGGGRITKLLLFSFIRKRPRFEWTQPDDVHVNVKVEQRNRNRLRLTEVQIAADK